MEFSAQQIAEFLQGDIDGNASVKVNNISRIESGEPQTLCFLANENYTKYIYTTKASIVLVRKDFVPNKAIATTLIRVEDPYVSFAKLLQFIEQNRFKQQTGISKTAIYPESTEFSDKETVWLSDYVVMGENVKIGKQVKVFPHVYIGDNCIIGDNSILYSGVKLYHEVHIGKNCIIHSGSVIGSDGFGFAPDSDGKYIKIPQLGNVIIEDDVEICANVTIDRASVGSTIIRQGCKIDNLVMIAHNCEIGVNTVIAAQAGFSGSTKVGQQCMIGGQVGTAGHISIGNNVKIAAQSGIAGNIPDNSMVMGSPAFDAKQYKRAFILFKNIEQLAKRMMNVEKIVQKKS
jgi:UDP-3-O-[3-hydroxymyristoyl] glucosamine N-acyltransferase